MLWSLWNHSRVLVSSKSSVNRTVRFYVNSIISRYSSTMTEEKNFKIEAVNLDSQAEKCSPAENENIKRGNLSKRAYKRLLRRKAKLETEPDVDNGGDRANVPSWRSKESNKEITDLINAECFAETNYYFENGLRKVYPYYYEFTAYAKGRWFGEKLIDVFVREFQNNTKESCIGAIDRGELTVNGKRASPEHIIKNGDVIVNRVHRHELPVVDDKIEVVADTDEVLVVNKPSSIPVHPCGRYRHNSLLYIMAREMGYRNLRGLYRLDRLTSGLLIFGRNEKKTAEMMSHIRDRLVEKEYVCRVRGEFPVGEITCEQPIGSLSEKLGIYRVTPSGKESKTTFSRMSYNGKTSVVKCKPYTGRTHQIRIHLQYLGYPIVNDPIYTGDVWGENEGKDGEYGQTDTELIIRLSERHNSSLYLDTCDPGRDLNDLSDLGTSDPVTSAHCDVTSKNDVKLVNTDPTHQVCVVSNATDTSCEQVTAEEPEVKKRKLDTADNLTEESAGRKYFDPHCRECHAKYVELRPDQLVMYLHAYSYKGPGWSFQTSLPKWAAEDFPCHQT